MNVIDNKTDQKRHRSGTKSIEDINRSNIKMQTSNRMKRKAPSTNSEMIHSITKTLDVVKSTEFEPRNQYDFYLCLSSKHDFYINLEMKISILKLMNPISIEVSFKIYSNEFDWLSLSRK
jgi:hypothetical protein